MISAVVLVKNQAKQLEECLLSLKWCSEIIVIDDNSIDESVKIAKKHNAQVFTRSLDGDFSAQRNFGLSKVTNEWALFVDADEVVPPQLAKEIYQQTTQFLTTVNGFYLKRKDVLWGKELKHGETNHVKLLRMGRKEKGVWEGKVHERWKILGETATFQNNLLHFPHPTVREFLFEINHYSTLRAMELKSQNKSVSFTTVLAYPIGKFFLNYFIRLGFLDGTRGIIIALMMSFHSFLVRGKLWQLNQQKRKYDFGLDTN